MQNNKWTKRMTDMVCYVTIVGWVLAWILGDKDNCKVHLNNSLLLIIGNIIVSIVSMGGKLLGTVGWIMGSFLFALWIIGFIKAYKGQDEPIPFIGQITVIR